MYLLVFVLTDWYCPPVHTLAVHTGRRAVTYWLITSTHRPCTHGEELSLTDWYHPDIGRAHREKSYYLPTDTIHTLAVHTGRRAITYQLIPSRHWPCTQGEELLLTDWYHPHIGHTHREKSSYLPTNTVHTSAAHTGRRAALIDVRCTQVVIVTMWTLAQEAIDLVMAGATMATRVWRTFVQFYLTLNTCAIIIAT